MTENMKKFLELVSKDEEFIAKIREAGQDALIAIAKELGFELTEEDLVQSAEELDDQELDVVAGGGTCACVLGGGGTQEGNDRVCACILHGEGADIQKKFSRCYCLAGGGGKSLN